MDNLKFNGIEIDVETVRAKLAEYERQNVPRWPVYIDDGTGVVLRIHNGGGAGTIEMSGTSGVFACWRAMPYVAACIRAAGTGELPPLPTESIRRQVQFGD